jgi:ribosome recycling factor
MEDANNCLKSTKDGMDACIAHLEKELAKIRAGKASPQMLDGLSVDYYGNMTPLNQVANVSTPDPRQLVIQPWEKTMLTPIEKAIQSANLGFNPINDGTVIRINVPQLTEERRNEFVKKAKVEGENAKIAIRNIRRDSNDAAKKLGKDGLSEDSVKDLENNIQEETNNFIKKVDEIIAAKEKEIMTI